MSDVEFRQDVLPAPPQVIVEKKERGLWPAIVITTMLSAGAGSLTGVHLVDQTRFAVLKEERKQSDAPVQSLYDATSYVKSIKPVIVNLADPPGTFIRVQGSVVFKTEAMKDASTTISKIEADIATYLRTLSVADLEGTNGLQNLKEDLNQRATIRAEGDVFEFILETMVIQ